MEGKILEDNEIRIAFSERTKDYILNGGNCYIDDTIIILSYIEKFEPIDTDYFKILIGLLYEYRISTREVDIYSILLFSLLQNDIKYAIIYRINYHFYTITYCEKTKTYYTINGPKYIAINIIDMYRKLNIYAVRDEKFGGSMAFYSLCLNS